jgi:hypothetical protein
MWVDNTFNTAQETELLLQSQLKRKEKVGIGQKKKLLREKVIDFHLNFENDGDL